MKISLTTAMAGVSLLLAAPASAQADPHAGHHPAAPTTTPATPVATPDATKPSPMGIMAMPPANGAEHGGMMMHGKMMKMTMMKKCMLNHAKHHCRRVMRRHHH